MTSLHGESTFVSTALWALARRPNTVAFVHEGGSVSYREALERTSRVARLLEDTGIGRGDGIVILTGNIPEAMYLTLAAHSIGARVTPLHPLTATQDQIDVVRDSDAKLFAFNAALLGDKANEIAAAVPELKNLLPIGRSDLDEDIWVRADRYSSDPVQPVAEPSDIANLNYTGGTTGLPKGVLISQRAMLEMTRLALIGWQLPREMRALAITPISHGAMALVVPTWLSGGTVILEQGFEPQRFCSVIAEQRITTTFVVPTIIYVLLDSGEVAKHDISSLETMLYGAAPMAPSRLEEALDVFGSIFAQLYGQTEAVGITSLLKEEHNPDRPDLLASCGKPLPGVALTLMDEDDVPVATGENGEICLRGSVLFDGYWKQPDLTETTVRSGWHHTGDMGRLDEDGYLYIVDRKKDMIISGGMNVYPKEVEDVLNAHPAVASAAVIGVPDERWGEAVKAVVVTRAEASPSDEDLKEFVRDRKGPINTPKSIDFVDALPLTALGKPDRRALRAEYVNR